MNSIDKVQEKISSGKLHVFTDSRMNANQEKVFVALIGEVHDASKFVPDVLAKSLCHAVVTDTPQNRELLKNQDQDRLYYVVNTTGFLQKCATQKLNEWRKNNPKARVLALTGSNGKTTTKEMLSWLLQSIEKKIHVTKGNLNNHIGVPLTILEMPLETEILLLEMGTNHPGEIEALCNIAEPDAGLITNIGQSHLEFFHNEDNVMVEKSALYREVVKHENGIFIINTDDFRLKVLKGEKRTVSFGKDNNNDFVFNDNDQVIELKFNNKIEEFNLKNIPEEHNRHNMGFALCLCLNLWPSKLTSLRTLAQSFKAPKNNRSVFLNYEGCDVYLDAYNANPSSMSVSIDGFVNWWTKQKKGKIEHAVFILGDMNELGDNAPSYHLEIGKKLASLGVHQAYFIGRFADSYQKGFAGGECFKDRHEFIAKKGLCPSNWKAPAIFIKASRTLQLEELIDITVVPAL